MNADIRLANSTETTSNQNVTQNDAGRIGTALGLGNTGDSSYKVDKQEEEKKKKELEKKHQRFDALLKDYSVKKEDVLRFIQKVFGFNEQQFFELQNEKFNEIGSLLASVVEFMIAGPILLKKDKFDMSKAFDFAAKKVSSMLKNGNTIAEARNFIDKFNEFYQGNSTDNRLFALLKMENLVELSEYNSLEEVPENVLENCIRKVFIKYKEHEGENSRNNIGKSIAIFRNLLGEVSQKDYRILYNAFIKVAKSEDEMFSALASTIESFQNNPEEFTKFVEEELPKYCVAHNMEYEKVKPIFLKIAKYAKEYGVDSIDFMQKILNALDTDTIYESISKIDENERTSEQKEIFSTIDKVKEILKIPEDQRTDEQKQFLLVFKANKKLMFTGLVASITAHSQKDAKKILEVAETKYGLSKDEVLSEVSKLSLEFDDINLDFDLLDSLTDGKFSDIYKAVQSEYLAEQTPEIGLPQKSIVGNWWELAASTENKIQELYKGQEDNNLTIVVPYRPQEDQQTPWQKFSSITNLSAAEICEGIAKKYIKVGDVLDKYNDLSQSAKDFVNKLIEVMSPSQQSFMLYGIKNLVVLTIIRHTNIDPSKLDLALDFASRKELERIEEQKSVG